MKKILLVLSLVLTIGLVGCSSNSNSDFKNVSASNVQKAIKSSDLLVETSMDYDIKEFDYFNDVNELIDEGFIIRSAMNVRLEDVIFIKAINEEDAEKIYSTLENYKDDMIMRPFGDGYGAEKNETIAANTIVEQKENYVYLISAENATGIEKVIIDTIKK